METDKMTVTPIHTRKDLINDCCALINSEWPRSKTARLRSLEASRQGFPTCLVLIKSENQLLGHCKISAVPNVPDSCYLESVVIHKNYRGLGLGKFLMKKTESYVMTYGRSTIYLSTKGQEYFYSKLGYKPCDPLTIYGTYQPSFEQEESGPTLGMDSPILSAIFKLPLPLPPTSMPMPPPLPRFGYKALEKTFMRKYLLSDSNHQ